MGHFFRNLSDCIKLKSKLSPQVLLIFATALNVVACERPTEGESLPAASESISSARANFYDIRRTQVIEIAMADWEALATQMPKGGRCNFKFTGEHFDTFVGSVRVNGVTFDRASIKKSSFCGSLSDTKPNLKIKLAKLNPSAKGKALAYLGTTELILKNSVQDQSMIRQCLAAELFAQAGFPRQLCNFTEVWANHRKVGLYVNLEPTDQEYLGRNLGYPTGNLYEVAGEELDTWAISRFKDRLDSFKSPQDKSLSDISALIKALHTDNTPDLRILKQHLDIDQFIRYWAMEIILVHWDGFANNINNSFIYFNPKDGRAMMLPRGMDQVLTDYVDPADSRRLLHRKFYNMHSLAKKLAENPNYLKQLKDTVNKYLNTIWNERQILARIDELSAITASHVPQWASEAEPKWSYDRLKSVILHRRRDIQAFLPQVNPKICRSRSADPDGDGWGWEDGASCKVI